jgi:histone H3/H4
MQSNECADMTCIPKTPFIRLVREIAQQHNKNLRFERDALVAIQFASETFLTMIFEMASVPIIHPTLTFVGTGSLYMPRG